MKALITGSFDPITVGHLDLIRRAAALFDGVVVAVNINSEKRYMFSGEERLAFVAAAVKELPNVKAVCSDGWAADLASEYGADVIVKGSRNGSDFEYESSIACVNKKINGVETLVLPCNPEYGWISSTAVREMIKHGKDYRPYVPEGISF